MRRREREEGITREEVYTHQNRLRTRDRKEGRGGGKGRREREGKGGGRGREKEAIHLDKTVDFDKITGQREYHAQTHTYTHNQREG